MNQQRRAIQIADKCLTELEKLPIERGQDAIYFKIKELTPVALDTNSFAPQSVIECYLTERLGDNLYFNESSDKYAEVVVENPTFGKYGLLIAVSKYGETQVRVSLSDALRNFDANSDSWRALFSYQVAKLKATS